MAQGSAEQQPIGARAAAPEVFISYASQDKAVAVAVCEALEHDGVTCWIAPRDVTPGAHYSGEIVHALDATKVIALILSQNAAASPHVLREVERATSRRHPVVALRIDQAPLPAELEYFLNTSHWLDASAGDTAHALPKLVNAVSLALEMPAAAPTSAVPTPSAPTTLPNRTAVIVASLIGLGIAGFAADRLWVSSRQAEPTPIPTLTGAARAPAPATATIPDKSVAVLPFLDMSEKKDQEYFADGMAEEIIDLLVKLPGVRVPARTSSFYFKGKATKISDIAQELGVAHVLEGSVRRSGSHLRVTAQLIRAANSFHLWSETYDRDAKDVFEVQDNIASAVVTALKIQLSPVKPGDTSRRSSSPEAYNRYLLGKEVHKRGDADSDHASIRAFQEAIAIDSGYAAAYAFLSVALTNEAGYSADPALFEQARAAAEKAISLAPEMSDGYRARAFLRIYTLDGAGALSDAERAVALSPSDSEAQHTYGDALSMSGRLSAAITATKKAIELDPLNRIGWRFLGNYLVVQGDLAGARHAYERALVISPSSESTLFSYAVLNLLENRAQDALVEFQKDDAEDYREAGIAMAQFTLGHTTDSQRALDKLIATSATTSAYQIAQVYAWRGQTDLALDWLERARRQRDAGLSGIAFDPLLRNLKSDPRFSRLLKALNIPDEKGG